MPDDGFKLVTTKKRSKTKSGNFNSRAELEINNSTCQISKESAIRRIDLSKADVVSSKFYSFLVDRFTEGFGLLGNPATKEILCYGLGHFAEDTGSRFQFGLLLGLKDFLNAEVFIYDPIFYELESDLILHYGCQLIPDNEEGKRKILNPTLVYLPHCCKQLTNNLLWSNWGPGLKNCVIFGNSFTKIVESTPKRILNYSANYILNINDYTTELGITNSFKHTDVFNDSAIHVFPEAKLNLITQELWAFQDEPKYIQEDTEFIRNLVSSVSLAD